MDHRNPPPPGFGARTDASVASQLLRSVAVDLAARVDHRLPGTAETVRRRVVVCGDGDRVVGLLGSYTSCAWSLAGEFFDKLTVALRHSAHQNLDPVVYARSVISTLTHELAHAITHLYGIAGTSGPGRIHHTEDFAAVATRLGLRVVRRPEHPAVVFTPGLSEQGRADYADLIQRVAQGRLHRTTGTGYAGPDRFHDLIDAALAADPSLGQSAASTPWSSSSPFIH
ncbi:hypothetical protein [Leucobacter tenebrionis]|uniref:hypothetical protein n=1 Tax=Leucobacter tenebrionis TaxID=2873270 RepID=UPI001CA67088|nr:hypothetical protein [Leucobacter tenebrionis]QZY52863.1 hypothetical protein KVY00_05350 [Leucobacter tenebrionis]